MKTMMMVYILSHKPTSSSKVHILRVQMRYAIVEKAYPSEKERGVAALEISASSREICAFKLFYFVQ